MEYKTVYGGNDYTFSLFLLKYIFVPDGKKYTLDYYDEQYALNHNPIGSIDHWGYYLFRGSIAVGIGHDADDNEYLLSNNRNPVFEDAQKYMLKQLNYPTGGYTLFEYEPHTYVNKIVQNFRNNYNRVLTPCASSIAGGVRIAFITHYASDTQYSKKIYQYGNGGNLLYFPRYNRSLEVYNTCQEMSNYQYRISENNFTKTGNGGPHIEYPMAIEGIYVEDGLACPTTFYYFSDYGMHPDQLNKANTPIQTIHYDNNFNPYYDGFGSSSGKFGLWSPNISYQALRGQLIRKTVHDTQLNFGTWWQVLEEQTFEYSYHFDIRDGYTRELWSHVPFRVIMPRMTKVVATTNDSSGTNVRTMSYNYKGQVETISAKTSNDKEIWEHYQYAEDVLNSSVSHTQNTRFTTNLWAVPISIERTLYDPVTKNRQTIGGVRNEFKVLQRDTVRANDFAVLEETKIMGLTSPVPYCNFNLEPYLKESVKYTYDEKGRPISHTDQNGLTTSYLWGYGNTKIIAEFVNVD